MRADVLPIRPPVAGTDPASRPAERPAVAEALMIDARQIGALLSVCLRTVRIWDSTGKLPQPVRIGKCVRWRRSEINDWIAAGCPPRAEWSVRRKFAYRA